jgi:hypothetical protein
MRGGDHNLQPGDVHVQRHAHLLVRVRVYAACCAFLIVCSRPIGGAAVHMEQRMEKFDVALVIVIVVVVVEKHRKTGYHSETLSFHKRVLECDAIGMWVGGGMARVQANSEVAQHASFPEPAPHQLRKGLRLPFFIAGVHMKGLAEHSCHNLRFLVFEHQVVNR